MFKIDAVNELRELVCLFIEEICERFFFVSVNHFLLRRVV